MDNKISIIMENADMIIGHYKLSSAFNRSVRPIEISGFKKIIKHYPTLDEALAGGN